MMLLCVSAFVSKITPVFLQFLSMLLVCPNGVMMYMLVMLVKPQTAQPRLSASM